MWAPGIVCIEPGLSDALSDRMWDGKATAESMVLIRRWAAAGNEDLLATNRARDAGGRQDCWGEASAILMKEDEAAFVARGRALAAKYHAYLGMGLAY